MAEDSNWGENTIRDNIRIEKEKVSKLSKKDKIQYFKSYYMVPTIIAAVVIIAAVMMFKEVVLDRKEIIMSGAVVNVVMNENSTDYLTDKYVEYVNDDDKNRQKAVLNGYIRLDYEEGEVLPSDYNNVMVIDTLIQTEQVDYFIVDENAMKYFTAQQICSDLSTIVDGELYDKMADRLYFQEYKELEGKIPVAINLSGTKLAKECEPDPEDSYLIFINKGKNNKDVNTLIKYVLGY